MSTYAAILVPLKKILCLIFCERVGQFECCILLGEKKLAMMTAFSPFYVAPLCFRVISPRVMIDASQGIV